MNVRFDPRFFGAANGGAQQVAGGDAIARAEIAKLKQFIATKVGTDIQLLSRATAQMNTAYEALAQRVANIENMLAQLVQASGGTVEHSAEAGEVVDAPRVREAANARPGDEDLPPEYFQGAGDEEAI